jgi:hypothetical protein
MTRSSRQSGLAQAELGIDGHDRTSLFDRVGKDATLSQRTLKRSSLP